MNEEQVVPRRFTKKQFNGLLEERWVIESELKQAKMDATDWGKKFSHAERKIDEFQTLVLKLLYLALTFLIGTICYHPILCAT